MEYKVRFVNFPLHYSALEDEVIAAVRRVLSRGDLIMRDDLKQFEHNMAKLVGVKHAIGVNSGTDALMISLRAAGIGAGDEVITVAHTFVATVGAIVHLGGKPILVDVGSDHLMNVDLVEPAITQRTKGIIPVHLNGRVCDMERISHLAAKHNLTVIEDAAQALGATFDGRKAGSWGLASAFSLYPFKMLGAFGDGGAVATDDDDIADKVRLLRDHGQNRATGDVLMYGYNSRLDNLQAAILNVKFKHLPAWIERRRHIARLYQEGLGDVPELTLMPGPDAGGRCWDVYQHYVLLAQRRDDLVANLRENGIEVLVSWPKPMHHHTALGLSHYSLPMTERISREVLSLPMSPELRDEEVYYVVDTVRAFYAA